MFVPLAMQTLDLNELSQIHDQRSTQNPALGKTTIITTFVLFLCISEKVSMQLVQRSETYY